ncbi:ATP-binding protein [Pseudoalteromonas sp. BZK2]|uniref:HAMP domain-containing sensor histidine kinase n=1 Tax=Pseudoalteromonas sp. BZK2 TaxID=1904458 RepID=UPI0016546250|nr:ATP-binding protein [Pseudoalteromonas sp. BZK2]MBC7010944.1 ATP-binding protein [Pseudoalteromonas sp. BZK2]
MARLFLPLYFGLLFTLYLFFIMLHILNTYLYVDVYNIIDADNFSAEVTLLNELEKHISEDRKGLLLQLIAERNKVIIEPISKSDIPLNIRDKVVSQDVWVDDEFYDYFKVFSNEQYYRMYEDESNKLIQLTRKLDNHIALTLVFMVALCCFIWFFNLYRKLQLIETTVVNISKGELSARVPTKSSQRVGRLNYCLNNMAEKLERLLSSHRRLTLSIAHEVRSPLFKMHLYIELLSKTIDKSSQEHFSGLEKQIFVMEEMVEELFQYAEMERAELKLQLKPIQIEDFLALNCEKLQQECKSKIHLKIDSPCNLIADDILLSRAIKNLVINADKYGDDNIFITVSKKSRNIKICIEDDGRGIKKEDYERVFQPYYRQEEHSDKAGFGLGLSIVKEIVVLHGADIILSNSSYGGAKFTLTFELE